MAARGRHPWRAGRLQLPSAAAQIATAAGAGAPPAPAIHGCFRSVGRAPPAAPRLCAPLATQGASSRLHTRPSPCPLPTARRLYFNNTDGLIFVVDTQDRDRIGRAAQVGLVGRPAAAGGARIGEGGARRTPAQVRAAGARNVDGASRSACRLRSSLPTPSPPPPPLRLPQEFKSIIEDPLMRNAAILVFANKQVRDRGLLRRAGALGLLRCLYWSCCMLAASVA